MAFRVVCLAVCLLATPALSQVVTRDSSPGRYGTPYAYLGPRGQKVWENYRRHYDSTVGGYPSAALTLQGLNGLNYSDLIMGQAAGGHDAYVSAGLFVGTVASSRSYDETRFALDQSSAPNRLRPFDVRLGLAEDHSAQGGSSFASLIANNGGENGYMDLYVPSWGVNGLELHLVLDNTDASGTWQLDVSNATLVGPVTGWEFTRTDYRANVAVENATVVSADNWDLGVPSTQPLPLRWGFQQDASGSRLVAQVGNSTVTWTVDDGVSLHGLTDPGNPDGTPYENGELSPAAFIPVLFVGIGGTVDLAEPFFLTTQSLTVTTASPVLVAVPERPVAGTTHALTVEMQGEDGQPLTDYAGTLHFSASDERASVPADYTFTSADQGRHTFSVAFDTVGSQSIRVSSLQLPELVKASADVQVLRPRDEVGWACTGAPGPVAPLGLISLLWLRAWLRPARRERR